MISDLKCERNVFLEFRKFIEPQYLMSFLHDFYLRNTNYDNNLNTHFEHCTTTDVYGTTVCILSRKTVDFQLKIDFFSFEMLICSMLFVFNCKQKIEQNSSDTKL